jgi:tetratricopeptide (TPR) repeat protein
MLLGGKPSAYTITAKIDTVIWVLHRSDWLAASSLPETKSTPAKETHSNKSGMFLVGMSIFLIMTFLILGPVLLEVANQSIPVLLMDTGRPDLAEDYLRFVMDWQPGSARLYQDLGDISYFQGKNPEAIEAYQQAIDLDAYLPQTHNNLGVVLLSQDQADLAADQFQMALNLDPANAETYHNLGNAYYQLEQWESAAEAYQRALAIDPDWLDVKAAWAATMLKQDRLKEAREAWQAILLEDPGYLLAVQGLGVISVLEGNPAEALPYLEKARTADPQDPTTRLYIGLALQTLERPAEAAAEFEFVLEKGVDPALQQLAITYLQRLQE